MEAKEGEGSREGGGINEQGEKRGNEVEEGGMGGRWIKKEGRKGGRR